VRRARLLLLVLLAGCLGSPGGTPPSASPSLDAQALAQLIGAPIEVDHDHNDPLLHTGHVNLEFVSWSSLGVTLGQNGFANFVFYEDDDEDLAFVAVDGDATGGFVIADVSDPSHIRPLGRYTIQGSGIQEVRVFPEGRYAIMNVQKTPAVASLTDAEGGKDCTVCLQVVDVRDRAHPTFSSAFAVDVLGSHNMHIETIDGVVYVFYVGQPVGNAPPGNYVGIARYVEDPAGAHLVKVAEYRNNEAPTDPKQSFPHDVWVETHPFTHQKILYVSHWQGGAITVDVTNPLAPRQLDILKDPAPSEVANIHWFAPEPRPRGAKLIAWSAPEIGALKSGSGVIRAYDATDPADLRQIGTWTLPGNVTIPGAFLMSPHITQADMDRGLLAVAHYHAGVWVLDVTDPMAPHATAYYLPHGDPAQPYAGPIWWKKPNFDPHGYGPNVYQARWKDGHLWVSDRGTGLYVLDYTGPVPGPLV
jgi:hypothetical protein